MPSLKTEFQGQSVSWSPFEETRLAVATAQNFGIVGNGKLEILQATERGIREIASFYTRDGLFDVAWSEENENHLVSASADGTIKLWDIKIAQKPLRSFDEHTAEVASVDWNPHTKDTFVSASWDDSLKLWTPRQQQSIHTWREHKHCVYASRWAPHNANMVITASGDRTTKLWDTRQPRSTNTFAVHGHEVLTADWNKYNPNIFASGSVDKTIKIMDIRQPQRPIRSMHGHNYAVKRLKFSPHSETQLASCSYDMSCMIWDFIAEEPRLDRFENHTEFVCGIDYNLFVEGLVASAGWDCKVVTFNLNTSGQQPPLSPPGPMGAPGQRSPLAPPPNPFMGGLPGR